MPQNNAPRSVYVVWRADGAHKIGFSKRLTARTLRLRFETKQATKLIFFLVRPHDACLVETLAHNILSDYRLEGEWFDVKEAEAISAVMQACNQGDVRRAMCDALREEYERLPPIIPLTWAAQAKESDDAE